MLINHIILEDLYKDAGEKRKQKALEYQKQGRVKIRNIDYQDDMNFELSANVIGTENYKTYINEVFSFDETIDDLLSLAYYNIGDIPKAIEHANKELTINPNNKRIQNNLDLMKKSSQN